MRKFVYDGREFPDPGSSLSTEEVKQHMAAFFPELATAEIRKAKKDGETTVYEFIRKTGTKGIYDPLTPTMIVAALHGVKEFHIDLVDLSWNFVKEDGTLDEEKMALHRKEIDAAADQANAYVAGVRKAVARLFRFCKRQNNVVDS